MMPSASLKTLYRSNGKTQGHYSLNMDDTLRRIYYGDNVGALRGPRALLQQARAEGLNNVKMSDCQDFLRGEPTYTLYRPSRLNYERNHIKAESAGSVVQIDIMDMMRFRRHNRHSYVLLSYDTYSKLLMGVAMRDRSEGSIEQALTVFINTAPYRFIKIYWDKEAGFLSRRVQTLLQKHDIFNYTTTSRIKAPGVERSKHWILVIVQVSLFQGNSDDQKRRAETLRVIKDFEMGGLPGQIHCTL